MLGKVNKRLTVSILSFSIASINGILFKKVSINLINCFKFEISLKNKVEECYSKIYFEMQFKDGNEN